MKAVVYWNQVHALKGKDFLTLSHLHPNDLALLLDLSLELKRKSKRGDFPPYLKGKILAMLFHKPSTRTRISFEVGMKQLGGDALFLESHTMQWGRGETAADTARVLSRYADGILIRTHEHALVEELAEAADIPVINGLTDDHHPCQILADLLTLLERKGSLGGLRLAYVGDGNNVLHSLMQGAALAGMHLSVATPDGFRPSPVIWQQCEKWAQQTGGHLQLFQDPAEAVRHADAVYTDVWVSMGQEEEKEKRIQAFAGYQVNRDLMELASPDAIFMHCLPAYRGWEVSEEVLEGPQSVVFDQAENRLHAQKALLVALLGDAI